MDPNWHQKPDWWERFIADHPVPEKTLKHFASVDWTSKYLRDPRYEPIPSFSRTIKPDGEDQFFATTINTPSTISHYLCLKRKDFNTAITSSSADEQVTTLDRKKAAIPPAQLDCYFLLATGEGGLDGHPGVMHGGMSCAILDETIGVTLLFYLRMMEGKERKSFAYTVYLNTTYRAQVPTSGEILVRTWLTKRDGRKWWGMGQIVDKHGTVCAEAECMYIVVPKQKL